MLILHYIWCVKLCVQTAVKGWQVRHTQDTDAGRLAAAMTLFTHYYTLHTTLFIDLRWKQRAAEDSLAPQIFNSNLELPRRVWRAAEATGFKLSLSLSPSGFAEINFERMSDPFISQKLREETLRRFHFITQLPADEGPEIIFLCYTFTSYVTHLTGW